MVSTFPVIWRVEGKHWFRGAAQSQKAFLPMAALCPERPEQLPGPSKCLQLFLQFAFCFQDIKEHFQVRPLAGLCERSCQSAILTKLTKGIVWKSFVFSFSVWKGLEGSQLRSKGWDPSPNQLSSCAPSPTSPVCVPPQSREALEFFFSFCLLKGDSGLM